MSNEIRSWLTAQPYISPNDIEGQIKTCKPIMLCTFTVLSMDIFFLFCIFIVYYLHYYCFITLIILTCVVDIFLFNKEHGQRQSLLRFYSCKKVRQYSKYMVTGTWNMVLCFYTTLPMFSIAISQYDYIWLSKHHEHIRYV